MPCFPVQGDLELSADGTRFIVASGMSALVQRIRVGLQTPLTTWRWDQTIGVPIFGFEKLRIKVLKAFLTQYFLSFDEVLSVLELNVTREGSVGNVTYKIRVRPNETLQSSVPFPLVN